MEVLGIVECRLSQTFHRLVDEPFAAFDDDPRNALGKIECRFELRCNHDSAGMVDEAVQPAHVILKVRVPNPDRGEAIGKAEGLDELRFDGESSGRVNETPPS